MKRKTPKQIKNEIKGLRKLRSFICQSNAFGESNLEKIDIQIEVLENDLDEDKIFDRWNPDETTRNLDLYSNARDALGWMNGDGEVKSLVKDWAELDTRKRKRKCQ